MTFFDTISKLLSMDKGIGKLDFIKIKTTTL